jgi:hypothetical protein
VPPLTPVCSLSITFAHYYKFFLVGCVGEKIQVICTARRVVHPFTTMGTNHTLVLKVQKELSRNGSQNRGRGVVFFFSVGRFEG